MVIEETSFDEAETQLESENTAFDKENEDVKGENDDDIKEDGTDTKAHDSAVDTSKEFDKLGDDEDEDEAEAETKEEEEKEKETKEKTDEASEEKDSTEEESDKKGEEENAATEKKDEKEEQEADDKVIGDDLIERAVRQGYSISAAKSFGSVEALKTTLELLESKSAASTQTKAKDDEKDTEKAVEELKFEPVKIEFENEADLDPELVAKIKAINEGNTKNFEQVTKTLNELRAQLAEKTTSDDTASVNAIMAEVEAGYAGLGKDYETLVGTGLTDNITDTTQIANRKQVVSAMRAIDIVDNDNGIAKSTPDLFKAAVKQVFSDKQAELTNKKVAKTLTERNKQVVNNPSGKVKAAITGGQAAVDTSKAFDKEHEDDED